MSSFDVKSMTLNMMSDWNKTREFDDKKGTQQQRRVSMWSKPPVQQVKINTNAACNIDGGLTSLGWIARDDTSQFIRERSKCLQARYQPRIVEVLSLREALSWTKKWRSIKCVFETDAKILVDAINTTKDNQGCSTLDTIVDDCRN